MPYIMIVIAVFNGRYYHEEPKFAVEYPTELRCNVEAAKYSTVGINFDEAVCVPKYDASNVIAPKN